MPQKTLVEMVWTATKNALGKPPETSEILVEDTRVKSA